MLCSFAEICNPHHNNNGRRRGRTMHPTLAIHAKVIPFCAMLVLMSRFCGHAFFSQPRLGNAHFATKIRQRTFSQKQKKETVDMNVFDHAVESTEANDHVI